LRISSPIAATIEPVVERIGQVVVVDLDQIGREASPLPLLFLDAGVWCFRIPADLPPDRRDIVHREQVESFFENEWLHLPRNGLDGQSPRSAAHQATNGNKVAQTKLEALIAFREQLGSRPAALHLYQGYPFDRLRNRLGLPGVDQALVDPDDLSCAPATQLRELAPESLSDARLAEAYRSAAGLKDDSLTEGFAAELLRRTSTSWPSFDLQQLVAVLIRESLRRGQYEQAFRWLDQAIDLGTPTDSAVLSRWKAELWARRGEIARSVAIYQDLLDSSQTLGLAEAAIDAATTLLDNQATEAAIPFLIRARDEASRSRLAGIEAFTEDQLKALGEG
jgi:hypothetical protein